MRKFFVLAICLSLFASVLVGNVQAAEITLRLADNQPEGYPTVVGAREFARLVEERTDGRIVIQVYPGGQLGDESSTIEQLQFGALDFVRTSITPMGNFEPAMNVLALPFLYPSGDFMFAVLESEIGQQVKDGLQEHGLVGLTWYDAGARSFYNNKREVTSPEDLAGLRIRVQESPLMMDLVRALGASPTPIEWGELYSALQTGVVDGAENNFPSYHANSHYEVAPYFTINEHTRIPELIVMSKLTWDRLSPEDREIIEQAAIDSTVVQRQAWEAMESEAREAVIAEGSTITEISEEDQAKFQEAVMHLYDRYGAGYEDIIEAILNFEME